MKRRLTAKHCLWTLALYLVTLSSMSCQEVSRPNFVHRTVHSVHFWNCIAIASSEAFDIETTHQIIKKGGWESNPLFGRYPTRAQMYSIDFGIDGASYALTSMLAHKIRKAGHRDLAFASQEAVTVGLSQGHLRGGIHNLSVLRRTK